MKLQIHKASTLSGHQNPIFAVENGPEAHMLFTAGNDKGVVQWNLQTMAFERVLFPVHSSVYAMHLLADTSLLAIGKRDGYVVIVDVTTQELSATLGHHRRPVFDIRAFKRKPELLLSSEDGTISVWSTTTFNLLYHFKVAEETIRRIAISPDERLVALGTKDGSVKLYNALDYSFVTSLPAHTMPVTSLCFSPDGQYLLTGGRDARLNVFETKSFSVVNAFTPHLFTVYGIAYHPSLPIFATVSRDKSIKVWSAADFRLLRVVSRDRGFESHALSINAMVWNPHKNQLISVSDDKQVMVWDVASL